MGPMESGYVQSYDAVRRKLQNGHAKVTPPPQPKKEPDPRLLLLEAMIGLLTGRLAEAEKQICAILSPQSTALEKTILVEDIIRIVCKNEDIRRNLIVSPRRSDDLCEARHMICYLSATLTERSLSQIGAKLGNRDHTTILHAYEKLHEERKTNIWLDARLSYYEDMLCRIR